MSGLEGFLKLLSTFPTAIFAVLHGGAHDGLEIMVDSVEEFSIVRLDPYQRYYNTWTVDEDHRLVFEYREVKVVND